MRTDVNWLSASGAGSSQVAASTMDTDDSEDEDDEGKDMDGVESRDDEDGKRVDIALTGTGVDLGESAGEEEAEAEEEKDEEEEAEAEEEKDEEEEAEGSMLVHMAEAETFTASCPIKACQDALPHNVCLERKRGRENALGINIKKLVLCTT